MTEDTVLDEFYSEIKAFRYDCGCLHYECGTGVTDIGTGEPQELQDCLIPKYFQPNGLYDFNCDQLLTNADIVLSEQIGACSLTFDGTVDNFFCLIESDSDCNFPSDGHFKYVDPYGIIHIVDWEAFGTRIDITFTTFDPRVPGQPDEGFILNKQVYRRGVITTTRQIVEKVDGVVEILSENSVQDIDFFRVTFECGDEIATDPFRNHYDCAVSDELEIFEPGTGTSE